MKLNLMSHADNLREVISDYNRYNTDSITKLHRNTEWLNDLFKDKGNRGIFGEMQLEQIISDTIPKTYREFQFVLENNTRVDCAIFWQDIILAIDSKFPLDNYKKFSDVELTEADRIHARKQFKLDIKRHAKDIYQKYVENCSNVIGAIMFIPAESIFIEICDKYQDVVAECYKNKIWIASPSTLMIILNVVRSAAKGNEAIELIEKRNLIEKLESELNTMYRSASVIKKKVSSIQTEIFTIETVVKNILDKIIFYCKSDEK